MACENKSLIQKRYKAGELGVFASYVRQEQTETSDVDVLVEFSETLSLLKFVNLENYLSDNLGVKVDLVHKAGLKSRALLIYGMLLGGRGTFQNLKSCPNNRIECFNISTDFE